MSVEEHMAARGARAVIKEERDRVAREMVLRTEAQLIRQMYRLSITTMKLHKQLSNGIVRSELVGAFMDLRNIANEIEIISKGEGA